MRMFARKFASALAAGTIMLASTACAQETASTAAVASTPAPAAQGPALWKVADEDTTIYLFGTVHALPNDIDWYKGDIAAALAASQSLVTEIKLDEAAAAQMQQSVMSKGVLPTGTTLRSLLSEEQKATYEGAMTKLGLPVAAFDQFEPWYAGMMMTMLPLMQQGYSPDAGVEKVLETKAGAGLARGELETIDYQLDLFDTLPQASQINFLIEASANIDQIKPMLDKMVAEWLEGDADALAVLMNEGLTDPLVAERLLYIRNKNWANWIDTRLDQPGTVFVAVGAGHLAGSKSVQDALSDIGIETVRVQ